MTDSALLLAGWRLPAQSMQLPGARCLYPLLDRPALQWAVERLVEQGVRRCHLLAADADSEAACRKLLGNGERWGLALTCSCDPHTLNTLPNGQAFRLARAESLPGSLLRSTAPFSENQAHLITRRDAWGLRWTGWGLLTHAHLDLLHAWLHSPPSDLQAEIQLLAGGLTYCEEAKPLLGTEDDLQLWQSNLRLLAAENSYRRIGLHCRIHPSASIAPDAMIGSEVRIGPGVEIGPACMIGQGSVLDRQVTVRSSVILPDTYVGPGLEIVAAIAGAGVLASLGHRCFQDRIEEHLLGCTRTTMNYWPPLGQAPA